MTNARGHILSFSYDKANRMTSGAGISYTYDAAGNIMTVTNENGMTERVRGYQPET